MSEPFFKAEDFEHIDRRISPEKVQAFAARANAKRDDELSRLRDENARLKAEDLKFTENLKLIAEESCQLRELLKGAKREVDEARGCFEAAEIEGLTDVLRETSDMRLSDLVQRRILYAWAGLNQTSAAIDASNLLGEGKDG